MHLDLLRKKLSQVESGQEYKAATEYEEMECENKDMHKKVEQLQKRLHEAKQTVQAMKSESVENKTLKVIWRFFCNSVFSLG